MNARSDLAGDDELNPYAAPTSGAAPLREPIGPPGEAEAVRRSHIKHEASIRSIGVLFYVGAFFLGLVTVVLVVGAVSGSFPGPEAPPPGLDGRVFATIMAVVYGALTALYLGLGVGLRGLRPWARWTTVGLTVLGLLVVALQAGLFLVVDPAFSVVFVLLGGLIPGYILYLLLSSRAGTIFSPGYKQVIASTPHVRSRTSPVVWVVLIVLVLVILGVIVGGIVAG